MTIINIDYYLDLWKFLSKHRKNQSLAIVVLMVISSISEVVSIGSILPFLGAISSPDLVYGHELAQPIISFFNITDSDQLILPVTIIFIVVIVVSNLLILLLIYATLKLSYAIGADLSIEMYRRTLYQDYAVHMSKNSSEVINGIINKTTLVTGGVVTPLLHLVSSVILLIGILSTLFVVNFSATLISMAAFGLFYMLILKYTKNLLKTNGEIIANKSTQMVKTLQEGLGGIRDVLIDNTQEFYCRLYRASDIPVRQASASNSFISVSPRFIMEAIGVSLIAGLAYLMTRGAEDVEIVIPILGVMAMGAQRLLPILQQIYASISTLRGARAALVDVIELLEQPLPGKMDKLQLSSMKFKNSIRLKGIKFHYTEDAPWLLDNINLTLDKGSKTGFIGKTGSGKSTLVDIIMGLIHPVSGEISIDDTLLSKENMRAWHSMIAHVPQSIYLSDSSIIENVAFGVHKDDIDYDRAVSSLKQACLFEFIQTLPDGYDTVVGEMGVQLSGGQRQRIGIARALYKKSKVIIFDEATSALDDDTEVSVMKAINRLDDKVTVLIIAHRVSTLKSCDKIVKLNGDATISVVRYQDL